MIDFAYNIAVKLDAQDAIAFAMLAENMFQLLQCLDRHFKEWKDGGLCFGSFHGSPWHSFDGTRLSELHMPSHCSCLV
jgi:hypothetical protein